MRPPLYFFLLGAAILSSRLPTTFGRACLVQVFQMLIGLVIGVVLVTLGVTLAALR